MSEELLVSSARSTSCGRRAVIPAGKDVLTSEVVVGMRHIPMEGEDHPVGKGQTWRVVSDVSPLVGAAGGSVRISWGKYESRWYRADAVVRVKA